MKIASYVTLALVMASALYAQEMKTPKVQAKAGQKIVLEVTGKLNKDDIYSWRTQSGKGTIQLRSDPQTIDFIPESSGTIVVICTISRQKGPRKEVQAVIDVQPSEAAPPPSNVAPPPAGAHPQAAPPALNPPALQGHSNAADHDRIDQLGFQPTGFMGSAQDGDTIEFNSGSTDQPLHSGPASIRIAYTPQTSKDAPEHSKIPWVAIAWQYPGGEPNWGDVQGRNLEGQYRSLRIWARGVSNAGKLPTVQFKSGGGTKPGLEQDKRASYEVIGRFQPLTTAWAEYCLDLTGKNLRNVVSAFTIVMERAGNPNGAIVYLDDVNFSNQACPAGAQH